MNLYPISSLFFYRPIFMCWLLLGEAMFLFKLKKRSHFIIRTIISYICCIGFAFAFPIPTDNSFYGMFMFIIMFSITILFGMFRYNVNFKNIFFSMICGYTTEHIAYEIYFALTNFTYVYDYMSGGLYSGTTISLFSGFLDEILYFSSYIIVYWLFFILFANRIKNIQGLDFNSNLKSLMIGTLFVVIDFVINSAVSYYGKIHYDNNFMGFVAILNSFLCIIALLFTFEMFYRSALKKNLAIMKEIQKEEQSQYKLTKETIDLINIKCHDLKHQIRTIGAKESIQPKVIENISNLINIYDSSIKTNNPVLNTILTEKSLFCSKNEIRFSCVSDETNLDFILEEDLYSLFGNIVDNAIEAVKTLKSDQRIIKMKIITHGNIISISEKNPYKGKIELKDGLPVK